MTYQIVDWLISYIECFVMLVVVTESGGRKFEEKKQAYLLLSFSLLNAILVAVCNQISAFSFISITITGGSIPSAFSRLHSYRIAGSKVN